MFTRLAAGIVLIAAVGWGNCASVCAAEGARSSGPASATRSASADGPASDQGQKDAIERLNPITFHGVNFRGDLTVWTAIVFLVVLAILWKFAWRPIAEGLDKRERNIAHEIAQAEAANEKAREILADYQRRLAAAEDQVRAILDQGRRDAAQVGRELIDKAKEDAKAEFERAVKQIDAATAAAIKELAGQSATLAVELAGKIVRAQINPSDHARLIQEAVGGFVQSQTDTRKVSRN
jgi:F-type H+-transporting ATPase subunit b